MNIRLVGFGKELHCKLNSEKVELLGKGACRGAGWQDGQWPLARGRKTLGECADICKKTAGCVAFDLSNKDGEKYDCLLLGHPGVLPASGLAAKCYIIRGAKPLMSTLREEKSHKKAISDTSFPASSKCRHIILLNFILRLLR